MAARCEAAEGPTEPGQLRDERLPMEADDEADDLDGRNARPHKRPCLVLRAGSSSRAAPARAAPALPLELPDSLTCLVHARSLGRFPARRALWWHSGPKLVQTVVESGVLPRLAAFMPYTDVAGLPLQAAWALTNVASGSSAQCAAVVEAGAVAPALALMDSEDAALREQAAWLLGNIAGDGA
ncbi:Importin subunit alpha-8, partial [Tetrabaena socialis]